MDFKNELITIKALDLLFYNYDDEMLQKMLQNREFQYVWDTYINKGELTHMQIWQNFLYKISYEGKTYLTALAMETFGEEATQHFNLNMRIRKQLEKLLK